MTLQDHLNAGYSSAVGLSKAQALDAFVADMKADPAMLAAAETHRDNLVDLICDKCFVSKTHRDFLNIALNKASTS